MKEVKEKYKKEKYKSTSTETEMAQILDSIGKAINRLLQASITCILLTYNEIHGLTELSVGELQYGSKTTQKSMNGHLK